MTKQRQLLMAPANLVWSCKHRYIFIKIGPIWGEKYVTVVLPILFLILALCQSSFWFYCDYLERFLVIFTYLWSICFNPLSLQIWYFFPFLTLSPEVNSSFSLCEDFLPEAFVCVTISSFLNATLTSSEPQNYQLALPFLLSSQILQKVANYP